MGFLASELIARVTVIGARQAIADFKGVGAASDSAGLKMSSAFKIGALAAVGIGVGIAALGVAAVKMAGDFQAGLTTLVTGAGEAKSAIGKVGQGILQISTDTATSTDKLTKAMFEIESGSYRGAQGLEVLKVAAEGARVGNSDLTKTTDVLLTTMHNYHLTAGQATGAMNSLVVTMQNGRMVMDDLNGALIKVLPVASALKVPLEDVQGALDVMAASGDKGAAAGTHLGMMFKMLSNPIGAAKSEMKAMGINSIALAETMRTSLPDALQMIQDAVAQHFTPGSVEFNRAVATILGGSKSGVAGLEIFSAGMKTLRDDTTAAADALRKGGKDVQGWSDVQKDLNFQLDKAHKAFDAMLIQLGLKLLPIITPIAGRFADWFSSMAKGLGHVDFSGLATSIQGITDGLGRTFDLLGKVGHYVVNSQSWKDAGTAIGGASDQLGRFVQHMQEAAKSLDTSNNAGATLKGMVDQLGITFGIFGNLANQAGIAVNGMLDHASNQAFNTDFAFQYLGEQVRKTGLNASDAQQLMADGWKTVTDATTGADINLAKLAKTSDLSGSSTVTLTHALELVGKHAGDVLTVADAAKLLAERIGNVRDMTNGFTIDLKNMVDHTGVYMSENQRRLELWYDALRHGSHQSFDEFSRNLDAKVNKTLKATGAKADDTRRKLLDLNVHVNPKVNHDSIAAGGATADQTHDKLLKLNGPYHPVVNTDSVVAAGGTADYVRRKLQNLNGSSTWNAFTNYINTGGPLQGHGFASGTDYAPGGMAWVGEQGPERMYVPRGAKIVPHQQSMSMGHGGTSNQPINLHLTLQTNGRSYAHAILPDLVAAIRNAVGTVAI